MSDKTARTSVPIHDLIARRWSPRAFDATRPVAPEQLVALLEAARWAPSCFGDEPWRYVVCDKSRNPRAWERALACLAEKNQRWARHAPVLILSTADGEFEKNGKPNRWGQHDTGAASVSLCLQATAMGLGAHQMGGFDAELARQTFGVPARYTCMAMIAVGHLADPSTLEDDLRAAELGPRTRRRLAERFFDGEWGRGVDEGA